MKSIPVVTVLVTDGQQVTDLWAWPPTIEGEQSAMRKFRELLRQYAPDDVANDWLASWENGGAFLGDGPLSDHELSIQVVHPPKVVVPEGGVACHV